VDVAAGGGFVHAWVRGGVGVKADGAGGVDFDVFFEILVLDEFA